MLSTLITKKSFFIFLFTTFCIQSITYAYTIRHTVEHVSQYGQPNVSPEILNNSCAVATLMMALKYSVKQGNNKPVFIGYRLWNMFCTPFTFGLKKLGFSKPSEQVNTINYHIPTYAQLCQKLQTDPQKGTSLDAVINFLDCENWDYKIITNHVPTLIEHLYDGPIGVIFDRSNSCIGHVMLLIEKNASGFTFLDPACSKDSPNRKQFISFDKFKNRWRPKIAIQIVGPMGN